ncbi:MAG: flavin reductase family protein [Chitinophagales bacterium]|jgi:flavin reductase (DIM6/NTAB) family NADH-FMN oxidoreductase RutF|nr:flavin reductase family protein [Chitinophagales bacterium]
MFTTFNPDELTLPIVHNLMLTSVAPRPIAFVSSIDESGNINLAPFSQFNVFSTNPPVVAFSASVSGRTGETKDTYKNAKATGELTVNIVTYDMTYQMSYASSEFPPEVNEFQKAGFTPIPSDLVKPPRVGESPVSFECKVLQIIDFGDKGGAGKMILAQVHRIHTLTAILDENGKLDPLKIQQVGRCGNSFYVKLQPELLFPIAQPQANIGIGIDELPDYIRHSTVLTGNNLGQLTLNQNFPSEDEIKSFKNSESYRYLSQFSGTEQTGQVHRAAQDMLHSGNHRLALICLFSFIS